MYLKIPKTIKLIINIIRYAKNIVILQDSRKRFRKRRAACIRLFSCKA